MGKRTERVGANAKAGCKDAPARCSDAEQVVDGLDDEVVHVSLFRWLRCLLAHLGPDPVIPLAAWMR